MKLVIALAALLLVSLVGRLASAHPAPNSVILLDVREQSVAAELQLPKPELEAIGNPPIRELVEADLHVQSPDRRPWNVTVNDVTEADDTVVVHATLTPQHDDSTRRFTIINDVIGNRIQNHRAWIGAPAFVGTTSYLHHQLEVNLEAPKSNRFRLRLGDALVLIAALAPWLLLLRRVCVRKLAC